MAETLARARLGPGLARAWRGRRRRDLDRRRRPMSPSCATARSPSSPCTPEDAGLPVHPFAAILGGAPAENAAALRGLLAGEAVGLPRRGAAQRRRGAGDRGTRGGPARRGCARARKRRQRRGAAARPRRSRASRRREPDDEHSRGDQGLQARRGRRRQGAPRPQGEIEAAARAAGPTRGFARGAAPRLGRRRLRPHRRDQAREPVQGPDPRGLRPGRAGRGLRRRRRRLPQRADRRPELPGRRRTTSSPPAPPASCR